VVTRDDDRAVDALDFHVVDVSADAQHRLGCVGGMRGDAEERVRLLATASPEGLDGRRPPPMAQNWCSFDCSKPHEGQNIGASLSSRRSGLRLWPWGHRAGNRVRIPA
jgi:hypothetical protein